MSYVFNISRVFLAAQKGDVYLIHNIIWQQIMYTKKREDTTKHYPIKNINILWIHFSTPFWNFLMFFNAWMQIKYSHKKVWGRNKWTSIFLSNPTTKPKMFNPSSLCFTRSFLLKTSRMYMNREFTIYLWLDKMHKY